MTAGTLDPPPPPVASASGVRSTFFWPMLLLPAAKRRAMFAIYGFCREVDDIVDLPGGAEAKAAALDGWRRRLEALYRDGAVDAPQALALAETVRRYDLPRAEFEAVIDGVAMDLAGTMRAPTLADLRLYCRRVAGAVGLLAIRVLDRADAAAERFALALGEAMQLTNILRDLCEDAELGRLYLPRELLDAAGIASREPEAVLAHPALPQAAEALAVLAEQRYAEAATVLGAHRRDGLWTAHAMMLLYRRLLDRLRARGWSAIAEPPRPFLGERAWLAVRCALGHPPVR